MLVIHPKTKIYLYNQGTDMRKSFNTLAVLVTEQLQSDPADGSLYVFCNKKQDKVKILQWDKNGFWLHYKRLAKGKFSVPGTPQNEFTIDNLQLHCLLGGISKPEVIGKKMF